MLPLRKLALKQSSQLKKSPKSRFLRRILTGTIVSGISISQCWFSPNARAISQPYCQLTPQEIAEKENLLQESLQNNSEGQEKYQALLKKHSESLNQCRSQSWLKTQAIWLRLYPCDIKDGSIEGVLDRIVNKGYNQVYLEVFFDSQVLLPPADNPTTWQTVIRTQGAEKVDLLAKTIAEGRKRGLKVYAWLFTMNFGYSYSQRQDRQGAVARNGKGENSTTYVHDGSQTFIDPYNRQAQIDYYQLVQAVVKRQPDGILFDYIRYPRGTGNQSVASSVKDLWIYSPSSRQALYNRGQNNQGRMLIDRFISQGTISAKDVEEVKKMFPNEPTPLWQGRNPVVAQSGKAVTEDLTTLRRDLWYLTVAHAAQGVIDFLNFASTPARQKGIPTGAVFFPGGNQLIGNKGFDSRLQPWDQFTFVQEWHPMSYALCGRADCVVDEIRRTLEATPSSIKVIPVIAGLWGQTQGDRPSLESQMEAVRRSLPQVNSLSHFAYSWLERELDNQRRFCKP
jgi:hypothetical protein